MKELEQALNDLMMSTSYLAGVNGQKNPFDREALKALTPAFDAAEARVARLEKKVELLTKLCNEYTAIFQGMRDAVLGDEKEQA